MGRRQIIWSKRAVANFESTLKWYIAERGQSYAQKFYSGILDTIESLAFMPMIGVVDEKMTTSKNTYYSFLSHPKYRIVYRYTDTTLLVVAIRATLMDN